MNDVDTRNGEGWVVFAGEMLMIAAAYSVWSGQTFGRVFGIASAALNAMILLFTVNAFPTAAFMLFLVDLAVIYGLAVYGGRRTA